MVEMPLEDARPLLRPFPVAVPSGVSFMKNSGLVTEAHPEEFEALAGRCAVFRFDSGERMSDNPFDPRCGSPSTAST